MFKKTKLAFIGLIAFCMTMVAGTASAALAALDVDAVTAAIQTDAQTAFDSVLPVVGVVLGLTIGLRLLKRFANKV